MGKPWMTVDLSNVTNVSEEQARAALQRFCEANTVIMIERGQQDGGECISFHWIDTAGAAHGVPITGAWSQHPRDYCIATIKTLEEMLARHPSGGREQLAKWVGLDDANDEERH